MTIQTGQLTLNIDGIDLDEPIFAPDAFLLSGEQAGIIASARHLGQTVFAALGNWMSFRTLA